MTARRAALVGVLALMLISASFYAGYLARGAHSEGADFASKRISRYDFSVPGSLEEAASAAESASPLWWLDSGGRLISEDGGGRTLFGMLPENDHWRALYRESNATDTEDGAEPQNLFRLVSREAFENVRVECSFFIERDNLLDSPYRDESNGILLMSRYRDADTLYYAGLRVDGTAVIKKKYHGTYYTLAETPVFAGSYDRAQEPNLLPHGTWISLRSETVSEGTTVAITLFMKRGDTWETLVSATDTPEVAGGTPPLIGSAAAGVRTDFMDLRFADLSAEEL